VQVGEAEGGAEFVVAEGGAEAEGDQGFCVLAGGLGDYLFAFGADFVAGGLFVLLGRRRGFGCEDYSFGFAGGIVEGCGSFDAEAEEHVALAEVGLGRVVEGVLFLDAGVGGGA